MPKKKLKQGRGGLSRRPNPAEGCVFCGERPVQKTLEHVFPRWLIRLTGDPKRIVTFGIPGGPDSLAFDRFRFPACRRCNEEFGRLEAAVKPVVLALLDGHPLNHSQAEALLDWFDKVRVGAWLAGLQIGDNPLGVRPVFRITTRVRKQDRLLYIGRVENRAKDLRTTRLWALVFQGVPSFFSVFLNGLYFVNLSSYNAASGPLGLPTVEVGAYRPANRSADGRLILNPQKENWPTIQKGFSILAQGVWPERLRQSQVRRPIVPPGDRSVVYLHSGENVVPLPVGEDRGVDVLSAPFRTKSQLISDGGWLFAKVRRWVTRQLEVDAHDQDFSTTVVDFKRSGEEVAQLIRTQRTRQTKRSQPRRRRVYPRPPA